MRGGRCDVDREVQQVNEPGHVDDTAADPEHDRETEREEEEEDAPEDAQRSALPLGLPVALDRAERTRRQHRSTVPVAGRRPADSSLESRAHSSRKERTPTGARRGRLADYAASSAC